MIIDNPSLFYDKIYARALADNMTWDHKLNQIRDYNYVVERICNFEYVFGKNIISGPYGQNLSMYPQNTQSLVHFCLDRNFSCYLKKVNSDKILQILNDYDIPKNLHEYYLKEVSITLMPKPEDMYLLKYTEHLKNDDCEI